VKSNYAVRIGDREKHGDTYEKYCQRCRFSGIEPKEFRAWLAYEMAVVPRRGPRAKLDDHQRVEAMQLQA
jgi:hypothetical protein